ncbi:MULTISPECIES: toprim domain-containing protein [Saccharibacillus]|uniref:DNA primase n=1 Tax=Saccharibacillus brassicae TaxID=2583377 RepID=A0A4Y6UTY8_SACBS|nr:MULTISPECIES: toprim domain-containing protein [Saccharibacillus]MWJ32445.1 DNA primase [Saccharibacillus sp. WB 17]QDH20564.1 DNA primase [Saccharibacillus brassicae]
MPITVIVEGKNDRSKIRRLLDENIRILCTFGTPNAARLESLYQEAKHDEVYLFLDNDSSGRKIRALLSDLFPDADHLYTRRGYAGVEGTPDEYAVQQLEKAGLDEFIRYPDTMLPRTGHE